MSAVSLPLSARVACAYWLQLEETQSVQTVSAAGLVENQSAEQSWDDYQELGRHGLLSPDPSQNPAVEPTFPEQGFAKNLGALAVEHMSHLGFHLDPA